MRKILFRGKRKDNGEWVYGSLIEDKYIVGKVIEFNEEYFNTEFWWEVIPETVGQFTGEIDKKLTKIFEGDIAKNDAGILFLVFYSQRLGFVMRRINDKGQFIDNESQWVSVANYHIFIEVIGNIHDKEVNDEH